MTSPRRHSLTPGFRRESLPHPQAMNIHGLSREILESHNKSLEQTAESPEPASSRVNTWVSTVGHADPLTSTDRRQFGQSSREEEPAKQASETGMTSSDEEEENAMIYQSDLNAAENLPTVLVMPTDERVDPAVLVAGESVLHARDSVKRLARVKSVLHSDSKGNVIEPVQISNQDRYHLHGEENLAFRRISLYDASEIHNLDGSVGTPSATSLSGFRLGRQTKRNGVLKELLKMQKEKEQMDDEDREVYAGTGNRVLDTCNTETPSATDTTSTLLARKMTESAFTSVSSEVSKDEKAKPGPSLGMGAVAKLRKWRVQTRDKYGHNNPQSFAQSTMHLMHLKEQKQDVAVDVPMPMKIAICEEVLPILESTLTEYQKNLGRSHAFTRQAYQKMMALKHVCEMYNKDYRDSEMDLPKDV